MAVRARKPNEVRYEAGRQSALADYRRGRMFLPSRRDDASWAKGYLDVVKELADTLGRREVEERGIVWDRAFRSWSSRDERKGVAIRSGWGSTYAFARVHHASSRGGRTAWEAVLTQSGAKTWDSGARIDVMRAIQAFASKKHASVLVTYRGREVTRLYPTEWGYDPRPRKNTKKSKSYGKRTCRTGMTAQSYLLAKGKWTKRRALSWAKKNAQGKIEDTKNYWRARRKNPSLMDKGKYATVPMRGEEGVLMVLGCPKKRGDKRDPGPRRLWIGKATRHHKGALRREAAREGALLQNGKISVAWLRRASKRPGATGKRARLALVLRGLHRR